MTAPEPDAPHVRTVLRLAAAMQRHALLLAVPVAVLAAVLAVALRGMPGLVGAVIGAVLGLVAGAVSTLVMRGTARTSPAGVMIGAMTSFAGKVLLLGDSLLHQALDLMTVELGQQGTQVRAIGGPSQTLLRHRKTDEVAQLNFAFANKVQRKW